MSTGVQLARECTDVQLVMLELANLRYLLREYAAALTLTPMFKRTIVDGIYECEKILSGELV